MGGACDTHRYEVMGIAAPQRNAARHILHGQSLAQDQRRMITDFSWV